MKILQQLFITLLLVMMSVTGLAFNSTYNVKVGDSFTVYTTYKSNTISVLWTYDGTYISPGYIGSASTSATFKALKPTPTAGLIIQSVTYYMQNGYSMKQVDDWKVYVDPVKVSRITITPYSSTLYVGQYVYLTEDISPSNATNKDVRWTSLDNTIAEVNSIGRVEAKNVGSTKIRCIAEDGSGMYGESYITVNPIDVTDLSLSSSNITMNVGDRSSLTYTISPSNATDKEVKWKTSDPFVATVSDGIITAVGAGEADITCFSTSNSSVSAKCHVTVLEQKIPVSKITIKQTSEKIKVNETMQLSATVEPTNATNKSVTWSSSASTVATVSSNGLVTAKSPGTATITCRAADGSGVSASCSVKVEQLEQITLSASPNGGIVSPGSKVTLTSNPTGATIYYTLDGTTPTSYSKVYTSSGITINSPCTLKAIAMKNGYNNSDVLTADYKVTYPEGTIMFGYTTEGIKMSFKVTDSMGMTCEVAAVEGVSAVDSRNTTGSVTIPSTINGYTVTSIGERAFDNCWGITSVSIPNTVSTIQERAFYYCRALSSVTIPESVTSIGEYAFRQCEKLAPIVIPNSVTEIGSCAFWNCKSLESVTLPSSLKTVNEYTFFGCSDLTSVTIPNSVTSIARYAFSGCTSLTTIKGYNNVEYIGSGAFASTPWDTNLPDGLNYIGKVLYRYKGTMRSGTKINVADGCTQICDDAFNELPGLAELNIPSSVTSIESEAIAYCDGLKTITVDAQNPVFDSRDNCNAIIEKATNCLIYGCTGTTIPSSVTSIGSCAFMGNTAWEEIVIPDQIDSIGSSAFSGNINVKRIIIGKGLKFVYSSFINENLKEIIVSANNPYFDSRDNCNAIIETATNTLVAGCSNTRIPNSVTSIGDDAFFECTSLTSVTIPNSVTSIGDGAFYWCKSLTSVTIGSKVKTIGSFAFSFCPNINTVISLNGFPEDIDETVFDSDVYNNATLYVPEGCRNNYQVAAGWSNFKNIVEGIPDGIDNVKITPYDAKRIYTPSGTATTTINKGINIINGKKYVVK